MASASESKSTGELTKIDEPLLEDPTSSGELSLDTTFELLKNRRRRDTLEYLWENGGEAQLGELAEHIAARENDIDVQTLSSDQRKRVYIGLYQCHLPKMDEAGVIDFDKDRGTIVLLESAAQLRKYLDSVRADPRSEPSYGLPVALGCAGLVVAGVTDVWVLSSVPDVAWTAIATVALVGLATVQLVQQWLEGDLDALAAINGTDAADVNPPE